MERHLSGALMIDKQELLKRRMEKNIPGKGNRLGKCMSVQIQLSWNYVSGISSGLGLAIRKLCIRFGKWK